MSLFQFKSFVLFVLLLTCISLFGQEYSIAIIVKNSKENTVYLRSVQGDNFTLIDSSSINDELIQFSLNATSLPGIYSINMGYSSEKNKQNNNPQLIDFIFNRENVVLETDFHSPETSTRIIESKENSIWLNFRSRESELKKRLQRLEKDLNYNWATDNSEEAINIANDYNQLQLERDLLITETLKSADGMFAAKLIACFREPLLDGYLTKQQRTTLFQKAYLDSVDFSNESLINSQIRTDKIFNYLVSFNQPKFIAQRINHSFCGWLLWIRTGTINPIRMKNHTILLT